MSFMNLYMADKGALWTADCERCGSSLFLHEHVHGLAAMPDAEVCANWKCDNCVVGFADESSVAKVPRPQYAGRYSAPGYMDCTDWHYGSNYRELCRELEELYGDAT